MRILVVRLSALGDLVHTVPLVGRLRRAFPEAEIDWLVDERFRDLVDLVPVVDRSIAIRRSGPGAWTTLWSVARELRARRYDVALDAQGLLKSAVAARLAGARRTIGFQAAHLREPVARWLYTESAAVTGATHVVEKNLALATHLGIPSGDWQFPIADVSSEEVAHTRHALDLRDGQTFALLNPGAAWAGKCWASTRYGELAKRLWANHQLRSAVSWGPGEDTMARAVAEASEGAAVPTGATGVAALVAHARAAAVVVAGDTGPLHLAAAVGTPVVGIYGPSDAARNGPWSAADQVVSVYASCRCRLERQRTGRRGVVVKQCTQPTRCLDEVPVDDVMRAVERRLGRAGADG